MRLYSKKSDNVETSRQQTQRPASPQPTGMQAFTAEHPLLQMQRLYGNRYVQRVLALAKKGDKDTEATPDVERAIQQARGSGQVLDSGVRAQMEPSFGADFSGVQVHAEADRLNRILNARAFTTGQDIFSQQGTYNPGSLASQELLAHELTHVVQQNLDDQFSSLSLNKSPKLKTKISPADESRIARWEISGNTATVNNRSDRLWNLAKAITGHGRDWPCIWPEDMKSPRAWDDNYERYIRIGDKFDISNLNLTSGPSATFTFQGADNALQALQALYGGTDPIDLEQEIANLANDGETPIQNLTIGGHTIGNLIWGDNADFSPSGLNPETPAPTGAGAHNKMGPRRCWFTRNATVRFVGCGSQTIARSFANIFVRRGASALGTNHWLCGWHQRIPVAARFMSVEGPPCVWPPTAPRLNNAAAINGAAGLWVTINGRL
jgi:hypothetical protein